MSDCCIFYLRDNLEEKTYYNGDLSDGAKHLLQILIEEIDVVSDIHAGSPSNSAVSKLNIEGVDCHFTLSIIKGDDSMQEVTITIEKKPNLLDVILCKQPVELPQEIKKEIRAAIERAFLGRKGKDFKWLSFDEWLS